MGTDILQLGSGGVEKRSGRMDATKQRSIPAGSGGFATDKSGTRQDVSFRRVLDNVRDENRNAARSSHTTTGNGTREDRAVSAHPENDIRTERTEDETSSGTPKVNNQADRSNAILFSCVEGVVAEEQPEGETVAVDPDRADEAEELVTDVFGELAEVLGIQFFGDVSQFSLEQLSDDTKEQFAEIIHVMKTMLTAMEASAQNGLPVELPDKSVSGDELATLTDTMRNAVFKLEMACNLLGIADEVQQRIDVASGASNSSGILQATDPSTLSMVQQHVERLFGKMFGAPQSDVQSEPSEKGKMAASVPEGVGIQITVVPDDDGTQENGPGTAHFESQVYRALLKIDALHKVGQENKVAGDPESDQVLPDDNQTLLVADKPGESAVAGDSGPGVIDGIKSVEPQQLTVQTPRLPDALTRMTEESVTRQVTEKLHTVIRSGLSEVRIQLRPESLGEVRMRIRMDGEVVLAHIEVQNQQVKEIMERNFGVLKDALAQHNITAGSFDVQIGNGGSRHGGGQQQAWFEEDTAPEYRHPDEKKDEEQNARDRILSARTETGRRYGANSIEYFG